MGRSAQAGKITEEMQRHCDALVTAIDNDHALEIMAVIMGTDAPNEERKRHGRRDHLA